MYYRGNAVVILFNGQNLELKDTPLDNKKNLEHKLLRFWVDVTFDF